MEIDNFMAENGVPFELRESDCVRGYLNCTWVIRLLEMTRAEICSQIRQALLPPTDVFWRKLDTVLEKHGLWLGFKMTKAEQRYWNEHKLGGE